MPRGMAIRPRSRLNEIDGGGLSPKSPGFVLDSRQRSDILLFASETEGWEAVMGDEKEKKELPHVVELVRDESLLHLIGHGLEKVAHAIATPKIFPGTAAPPFFGGVLRPNSVWAMRGAGALKGAGRIVGHAGILVDMLQSTNQVFGDRWEHQQVKQAMEAQRREQAIREKTTPKVEQGIAYKDGTVQWPQSHTWDFRPTTITLRSKHSPPAKQTPPFGKITGLNFGTPKLAVKPIPGVTVAPALGRMKLTPPRLGASLPFAAMRSPSLGGFQLRPPTISPPAIAPRRSTPASPPPLGRVGGLNLGRPLLQIKPTIAPRPTPPLGGMKLSLPKLGQSMPFKPMATPSLGNFRLRAPTISAPRSTSGSNFALSHMQIRSASSPLGGLKLSQPSFGQSIRSSGPSLQLRAPTMRFK